MALVRYGGGIVQMSGAIAGDVFARNATCNYVRARTKPTNPNTEHQQKIRGSIAVLCARWSTVLTAAQRAAWGVYASNVVMKNKLGESVYLSGFNHYIRSNIIAESLAETIVDAGPVIFELPGKDPTLSVSASEATQELTIGFDNTLPWAVEDGGHIYFFQGLPQNAQRNYFGGPWRFFGYRVGVDPGGPVEPYVNTGVFAVAEGQHQWVYARIRRADGRLSEIFRADTFCAA